MIPNNLSQYNSQSYPRPDDFVDPKEKQSTPDWCHMWAEFIYSQYMNGSSAITQGMRDRMEKRIKYAEGRQDTDIYKNRLLNKTNARPNVPTESSGVDGKSSTQGKRDGYANINFEEIFSPIPKYLDNIMGILSSQDHDIKIDAIDENSGSLRQELKYMLYAKKELMKELQLFNTAFNLQSPADDIPLPESIEELDTYAKMGMFKLPYEIGMKKACNHTDDISKIRLLSDAIKYDMAVHNMACTETYVDTDGLVKHEQVDLFDVIVETSKKNDHSDASFWARIKWLTAGDIKEETGWDDEKMKKIVSRYAGMYGNPSYDPTRVDDRNFSWASYRIPVLRCYWKSVDSFFETTRRKDGKVKVYTEEWKGKKPRFYNSDQRSTTRTDIHTLYHCNWVIGEGKDFIYDYGRPQNLPYNYETKEVEPPIHLYKGRGRSIVDRVITIADDIQFQYLKLQAAIIKAPPPGIKFDISSLDNITLDGNKKLAPLDVLDLYSQTGDFLYRLAPTTMPNLPGHNNPNPIEELRGGLGTAITDAITAMEFYYRQLDILTGIDPLTTANQAPKPDQGKAVTEMAVASTANALKQLYAGYLTIKESQTKAAVYFIQALSYQYEDNIEESPYYKVIGKTNLMAIITAGHYNPICYGFTAKPVPSDHLVNEVIAAARDALNSGRNGTPMLKPSEYLFIVEHLDTFDGIQWARLYLSRKEQIKAREDAEMSAQAQKLNTENALAIEREKQNTEKIKAEEELRVKKELESHKTNELIKLDNAKTENLIRLKKETGEMVTAN